MTTRGDETLVKDADLRDQLEAQRGKLAFEITLRHLIGVQEKRDAERRLPRETRRRLKTREAIAAKAPELPDLRHIHSVLAICGLPYRRTPLAMREFERRQGQMKLIVEAGNLTSPENGDKVMQPIPFGPKARLLMMHLCSEAVRQKSPTIEIADNLTAFMRDMGFPATGGQKGTLHAFKEQLNALAAARMTIAVWNGERAKQRYIQPFSEVDIWMPLNPHERVLWPTTLTFSLDFYESLKRHALPLNAAAVRAFAGSARKLDLYFWLGWRLNNIETTKSISWTALTEQFGSDYDRATNFRRDFAADLKAIQEVFPKLPVKLTEDGLVISGAGPNVLALPAPRPSKKAG
ncbi:MAG: replication protein RepA [Hyphomicrobiales bacterium]|nr:replication protein RepA [Hyphomicrobiales bacterium]